MPRNQALVSLLSGIIKRSTPPNDIPYFKVDMPALKKLMFAETVNLAGAANDERFDHGDLTIGQDTFHVHIKLTKDGSNKQADLGTDPNCFAGIFIAVGGNGAPNGSGGLPKNGSDAKVNVQPQGDSLVIAISGNGVPGANGSFPPRPCPGEPGGNGGFATSVVGDASTAFAYSGNGGPGGNGTQGVLGKPGYPGPKPFFISSWMWSFWRGFLGCFGGAKPVVPPAPGGTAGDGGDAKTAFVVIGDYSYGEAVGGNGGNAGNPGGPAPGGTPPGGGAGKNGNGGSAEVHHGDHSVPNAIPGKAGTNASAVPGTNGTKVVRKNP